MEDWENMPPVPDAAVEPLTDNEREQLHRVWNQQDWDRVSEHGGAPGMLKGLLNGTATTTQQVLAARLIRESSPIMGAVIAAREAAEEIKKSGRGESVLRTIVNQVLQDM